MAVNEVWLKHRAVKITTCELKAFYYFLKVKQKEIL